LLIGVQARPARDGPAFEHPVHLQSEVPVQPGRVMFLHDEAVALAGLQRARGLGGAGEVALGVIAFERISHVCAPGLCAWSFSSRAFSASSWAVLFASGCGSRRLPSTV